MAKIAGKRVLITGAAQGIGFYTAHHFAKAGCELILTDIQEHLLNEAAEKLRQRGGPVHTYVYDVADEKRVQKVAAKVLAEVGDVDILINNAGIGHTGELAETSMETWKKLMAVNFWGPLYHIYAFLPRMKERRAGQIVNVSSGQAFFRLPTWGAYAAIKAAFGAVSEILHFELKKNGIHVTTVYPFMVNTPFYNAIEGETWGARLSMRLVPYYSMSPEKVGKIIFKAAKKRTKVEMVSLINDLGFYLRFVPFAPDVVARTTDYFFAKRAET